MNPNPPPESDAPSLSNDPEWTAAPSADELASIIVLCCNEVEVTRLCLGSVRRHTRPPYELVLIDNGSADDTPAYLESVKGWPEPARAVVIRNETNQGYPAGVNQGLAAARGDNLVLLNNDVVVTPGWLDRLTKCARYDHPATGLVGPVTNYAPPPQRVEPGYTDLAGLDAFATRRAAAYAGQAARTDRLTGFCLLVRREVVGRVGGLDEGFGLGFFDDDDLCLRARWAGFRPAVALDCYVHHFGSRTFRALGVDTARQLEENLARYRDKWGAEEAARYRPVPAEPVRRTRVSLTMIVKNEERHLPDCLASVNDLVDEMIVVDTGSTDRTKAVAASYGAKVSDFPWVDDFAAARNEALRHATGDWVFWMDADDRPRGSGTTRTTPSCCSSTGPSGGRPAIPSGRRRPGGGCWRPTRRPTSPASTPASGGSRPGTTWPPWLWKLGT
jgi:GT2 family glycosyltransferase